MKRLISASRRTDLVAHYPDLLAERIAEIGPEAIHTLVLWTKDPANLLWHPRLRRALEGLGQVCLHWTVTGLGGTVLESHIRPPAAQVGVLPQVVALLGSPARLAWRYDPLITARRGEEMADNVDLARFAALAEPFARSGVLRVHASFVTLYPKVRRRATQAGAEIVEYSVPERRDFLERLRQEASHFGLEVIACCEPGQPQGACIDGALLGRLHPGGEPCTTRRARDQRPLCGCTNSYDLGHYLRCPSGCLYCYGSPACNTSSASGV